MAKRKAYFKEKSFDLAQHIIYIANTPSNENMPVMDVPGYMDNSLGELLDIIKERRIHFSIMAPRKLPQLARMFSLAGGNIVGLTLIQ